MAGIKLNKQQQQYLVAGVVGVAAFGFVYIKYFWAPTSQTIREAQDEIASVNAQIETAKSNAARLPQIEKELEMLNLKAIEAERRLPKAKDVPGILVRLTSLAAKHGIILNTFSPAGQQTRDYFFELSYPIALVGSFHMVGKFLAAIAQEERIFNIQHVNFGAAQQDTSMMSITFTLLTYQYKG